jgi:hypothetical protein
LGRTDFLGLLAGAGWIRRVIQPTETTNCRYQKMSRKDEKDAF